MRKAKLSLLAVALLAGMAGKSLAADRAGIGLEWSVGPSINLGPFDMKMEQGFGVDWMVGDDFTVAVFGSNGKWSGEQVYTDDVTIAGQTFDRRIQVFGDESTQGLRLTYALPFLKILKVGMELGRVSFAETATTFQNSDGSASGIADFGGTRDKMDVDGALEGVSARVTLLSGSTGTITTSVSIMASLRFVQFRNLAVFGVQESTVDTTKKPVKEAIDPVSSYNTLALGAAVNVGF